MSCNCQIRNQSCKKYGIKEHYRQALRSTNLQNPMEKWECSEAEEKTCPQFKPYPPKMTGEEYDAAQDELLQDIPKEFHGALCSMAYDNGHSGGYEETVNILRGLVSELKDPIKAFEKRIKGAK